MTAKWTDFVSGAVLTAAQLNDVLDNFADTAIFNESQAANTSSGTFTSGSYVKRILNTTVVNNIAGCTLSSSVISLPAGTYLVSAKAPAYAVGGHKIILQNTTDATTTLGGTSERAGTATDANISSFLYGQFTIAATKNFELQHRCTNTLATNGLGERNTFDTEVYATIQITRVG
jgi:hypothetical protein